MDKACLAIVLSFAVIKKPNHTKRKGRLWVKEWLKGRDVYSHINLLDEIQITDQDDYRNYFRMNEDLLNKLLVMVAPYIKREDTNMRQSISVKQRLALTLRFLATGRSFEDLKFSVLISPACISQIVIETCSALVHVLQDYIKFPSTCEEWKIIARQFGEKCNFSTCLGAIDGKHIAIRRPNNTASLYYNYKGYYSIVLMALVNADRQFIMVDVGANGRVSDGGVLFYTKFWELFQQNELKIPHPTHLLNSTKCFPYVFVADEAFALNVNLLKPYSQKNCTAEQEKFNHHFSATRCVVENAFGILAARFGVFQKPICLAPEKATTITLACCYLHNFLMKESPQFYTSTINIESKNLGECIQANPSRNSEFSAKEIRDQYCNYFNNEGKI